MTDSFLQSNAKEFVESRAMERNGSGVSPILKWRFENGTQYDGAFERVIHNTLNHVHSFNVEDPVYAAPFNVGLLPTGTVPIPGTGIRRVAIRARGVAAKIPTGAHTHVEGQARYNRFGMLFSVRINQDQINGHYVKREVSYMPDTGFSVKVLRGILGPTSQLAEGGPVAIGLNTFDDIPLSDEAHKIDRIIYFSVNGPANISQGTLLGWLSSGISPSGDGLFIGGLGAGDSALGPSLGLSIARSFETRNEDGLNLTSLSPPHGMMFANSINSVGMDVKILGVHSDDRFRPVIYRELQAI